ncbi:nitrogenase component 1 [Desulfobacter curvatus]|uniref:nitrogenase component 1 n=1 Tax=Desulfobacter curvatus TaxID=2290 RepID=UPI000366B6DF|nr:nitrogenase component 1 [Desulfobacter curvatus]
MTTSKLNKETPSYTPTQNACKMCTPLGATLVFQGIEGSVPLLHGSQGCSTYMRRYLISHYKEPVDIASSNFTEETAVFGGGANLKLAIENVTRQYAPAMIGIATTCLSETIGDDVQLILNSMGNAIGDTALVHVSTPSYTGTHVDGFHGAVAAVVDRFNPQGTRTVNGSKEGESINLFPGMLSNEDLRPEIIIGNSKGYAMARRLKIPMVRVGFPIHDRIGGSRILHVGYKGALQLFDNIVNTILTAKQTESRIGYSYM